MPWSIHAVEYTYWSTFGLRSTFRGFHPAVSRMTSWRSVALLFLIVSFTSLSRQNCANYFDMTEWTGKNLTFTFQLANTTNRKDLIKCTMKDACEKTKWDSLCAIQKSCFNGAADENSWTCRGSTSQNISFYHLMCLAAISLNENIVPEGCKYENVCGLCQQISSEKRTADAEEAGTWRWLIISGILNIVLLLLLVVVLFLFLRSRTQDRIQDAPHQHQSHWFPQEDSSVLDETTRTQDTHLMTPIKMQPDCPLLSSTPADTSGNGHTSGNRSQ
ncbi:uncharacterized protein [Paralichthys olivaceus]|uniref:uncharacterized protein isoform X5 n=1 Tax=Paralichthys olivaceus TaxID=8255 RepID=UPI0037530659